jgi:glycosyltransferase involved in cell wall biosynthesis
MRVLHVTSNPDGDGGTRGEVKAAVDLALGQKARGYDVTIATDRENLLTETCHQHGISVIAHDSLSLKVSDVDGRQALRLSENAVRDFIPCLQSLSPDIVHCHSIIAGMVGIAAGNKLGISCVLVSDGSKDILRGIENGLRFGVLCLSQMQFDKLKDAVPDVYYVPNGANAPEPSGQVRETGDGRSAGIIMATRLIPRKGVDIAILAMYDLRRRLGHDCPVLHVYGDGTGEESQTEESLTEMAAILGLNDIVQFHGFQLGILGDCPSTDILIMPSRWEAGPLIVLEAMSRGMPIVATAVGDITSVLPDQRYGRVIPVGSPVALADAIESLLADIAAGRFNPDLLIERYRSYYSIEKWAERVEVAYEQFMHGTSMASQQAQ